VTRRATVTTVTSLLLIGIGLALLVESAIVGAGSLGWALAVLFVLAGAGRLYLSRR
jgi:hypothetical protein